MEMRALGRTGLSVSVLGLGTVKLGRNRGLKYPGGDGFELPTDEQATALLRASAELGVNLIDTAPAYGVSEERIGGLMAANGWFGDREKWVVCTKVGEEFDAATGESRFDFSPSHVRSSVERSLRRLRVDALDIVLLHCSENDERDVMGSGALDELREMKQQGLIRAVGASTKSVDAGLLAVRERGGACDVVMVAFGPADRQQGLVVEAARLRGVGVLVKKGLASGHIQTIMAKMPPEIRARTDDPVESAMRFTLGRAGVSSFVVGTARVEHLRENAAAAERSAGK
jgi:aryl-alcohol dehydrogenase-like predicted oxidoreductase